MANVGNSTVTQTLILDVDAAKMQASLDAAERELGQLANQFDRAQAAGKAFSGQTTNNVVRFNKAITKSSRQSKAALQNVGFQLQDIAVQVGSGQGWTRALGQQLPQLASGFGIWGVAIGTAAAVLIPLIGSMVDFGDEALTTNDALEAQAKALNALREADREYQTGLIELTRTYGGMTPAIAEVLRAQRDLANVEALIAANDLAKSLAQTWGDLSNVVQQGGGYTATALELAVQRIGEELEISTEQANLFGLQLLSIQNAQGPEALAEAVKNAREQLELAVGDTEDMNEETRALYTQLLQAEKRYAALAVIDAASGISLARDRARELADALNVSYAAAVKIAGLNSLDAGRGRGGDPRAFGNPFLAGRSFGTGAELGLNFYGSEDATGGGTGGTGGGAEKLNKELERTNKLLAEAEKAANQFGRTMEDALTGVAASALDGFVDGLVDGELAFKDFARSILKDLAKIMIRAAIVQSLMAAFGGTAGNPLNGLQRTIQSLAGISFNAKGNAFDNGDVTAFAKGGVVNSPTLFPMSGGSLGMMGEAGPEAIVPLARNTKGDLGVGQAPVNVTVINNSASQVDVVNTSDGIEIIVNQARQAVQSDFTRSMSTGQGAYARGLEMGYNSRRKAI